MRGKLEFCFYNKLGNVGTSDNFSDPINYIKAISIYNFVTQATFVNNFNELKPITATS